MQMKTYPEIVTDRKVSHTYNLSVHSSEEGTGLFIIHPVGSINTNTSPILQKEMQQILKSKPEIILIDMNQVNFINFRGLRVILKTIMEMNQRNGKICLTNLQPNIKEMFEIMHDILPKWIFEGRKQLEYYLDGNHNNCFGSCRLTKFDDADKAHNLGLSCKNRSNTCYVFGANG